METVEEAGGGILTDDLVVTFREVLPTFEMQRRDDRVREEVRGFYTFFDRHCQVRRADGRDAGRADEQQDEGDVETAAHFFHSFVIDGVAGDVDRVFCFTFEVEDEACDRATVAAGGTMTARGTCDR